MPDDASVTPTELAQNKVFERFARAGYVVSGSLHLIVGYLAIRIALGAGGTADQSGGPGGTRSPTGGGRVALWGAAAALLTMGLWRLIETVLGRAANQIHRAAHRRGYSTGRRLSGWPWCISLSRTLRLDSLGALGGPLVSRIRPSAHA